MAKKKLMFNKGDIVRFKEDNYSLYNVDSSFNKLNSTGGLAKNVSPSGLWRYIGKHREGSNLGVFESLDGKYTLSNTYVTSFEKL